MGKDDIGFRLHYFAFIFVYWYLNCICMVTYPPSLLLLEPSFICIRGQVKENVEVENLIEGGEK